MVINLAEITHSSTCYYSKALKDKVNHEIYFNESDKILDYETLKFI